MHAKTQTHEHLNTHEQMATHMNKENTERGRLPSVPWDQT